MGFLSGVLVFLDILSSLGIRMTKNTDSWITCTANAEYELIKRGTTRGAHKNQNRLALKSLDLEVKVSGRKLC